MSVTEILEEAFAKVQAEHGIALERVSFDLVELSNDEREFYASSRIEIEGRAISRVQGKKTLTINIADIRPSTETLIESLKEWLSEQQK